MHISPDRIAQIERRFEEAEAAMARPDLAPAEFVRLSKDYAEMEPVVKAARALDALRRESADLDALLAGGEADAEMRALAQEEAQALRERLPAAEHALALQLFFVGRIALMAVVDPSSSSFERSGLAARHAWNFSSHSARSALARSAAPLRV